MALSPLLEHDFSKFRARRDSRVKSCIPSFIKEQFGQILANVLFQVSIRNTATFISTFILAALLFYILCALPLC